MVAVLPDGLNNHNVGEAIRTECILWMQGVTNEFYYPVSEGVTYSFVFSFKELGERVIFPHSGFFLQTIVPALGISDLPEIAHLRARFEEKENTLAKRKSFTSRAVSLLSSSNPLMASRIDATSEMVTSFSSWVKGFTDTCLLVSSDPDNTILLDVPFGKIFEKYSSGRLREIFDITKRLGVQDLSELQHFEWKIERLADKEGRDRAMAVGPEEYPKSVIQRRGDGDLLLDISRTNHPQSKALLNWAKDSVLRQILLQQELGKTIDLVESGIRIGNQVINSSNSIGFVSIAQFYKTDAIMIDWERMQEAFFKAMYSVSGLVDTVILSHEFSSFLMQVVGLKVYDIELPLFGQGITYVREEVGTFQTPFYYGRSCKTGELMCINPKTGRIVSYDTLHPRTLFLQYAHTPVCIGIYGEKYFAD